MVVVVVAMWGQESGVRWPETGGGPGRGSSRHSEIILWPILQFPYQRGGKKYKRKK